MGPDGNTVSILVPRLEQYIDAMDNGISKIIDQFGQMGQISCRVFGIFSVELSAYILSLCVPSP